MSSNKASIDELMELVIYFRDQRDWQQFHNSKDLALSLSLESSELLENFQWKTSEEAESEKKDEIQDELADVVIYALMLAHELDIDLSDAVTSKLKKNNEKYPVAKSKGNNRKYKEF
ncbi:NTP pyrophosphatase, house-cleaning of non-canonical NTPs [Amphibacillus marinus]|uniref:NTP pyrophosphatase, house-cleaning of non-canonical NTPs n=1 Tax=Amphibacillus marinus TaxID=872970 RepID=A0A1H8L0E8_9BACI|nr:nucleotide pyrophosphohydrolase [Amphibacillus marinus]SEN98640.1 NTP pyrophosphatase, house-cleaning of non-canonical NTPs [Amphibacillus marinus]